MAKQSHEPGPGRSTSQAAFDEVRKEIAEKNEKAHREARKIRTAREQKEARERRQRDTH